MALRWKMNKYEIDNSIRVTQNDLKKYIGKRFEMNNYGELIVLGLGGRRGEHKLYICEFTKTGYQTMTSNSNILSGRVKDPYYPIIYGIGYLGGLKLSGNPYLELLYVRWKNMLARCYYPKNPEYVRYTSRGVSVDDRWHDFSKFVKDYEKLYGYDYDNIDVLAIDKDIIGCGTKYSKEHCCLVNNDLNSYFAYHQSRNNTSETGIYYLKVVDKWRATISINGNSKNLGHFKHKKSALDVYWGTKFQYFKMKFKGIDSIIYNGAIDKLIRDAKLAGVILEGREDEESII